MAFSCQLGTMSTNQCNQFAGRNVVEKFALNAGLAFVHLDQEHAFSIMARAETERPAQATALYFMLRKQAHFSNRSIHY